MNWMKVGFVHGWGDGGWVMVVVVMMMVVMSLFMD